MALKGFVKDVELDKFREKIEKGEEEQKEEKPKKKKDQEFDMDKFLENIDPKEAPKVMKAIKVLLDRQGFVSEKELQQVLKEMKDTE